MKDANYYREYRLRNRSQSIHAKLDRILEILGENITKPADKLKPVGKIHCPTRYPVPMGREEHTCQFCKSTKVKELRMAGQTLYRCDEHMHG